MTAAPTPSLRPRAPTFFEQVIAATPGGDPHLELCIQCGTCGGSCPSGADMEHSPRRIFAMIEAGMKEDVLRSNTPWYCVSCYYCMVRCPQDIHITDLMYTLKRMAIAEGYYQESSASDASDFSTTFIEYVENYGRSFELGLATRHHLRHHPLSAIKMATTLGLGMWRKGRMDLTPNRIQDLNGLKAILAKAKELGGEA
ncbi:MAG: 4Fe-4S dicluster domain-containing protein [Pseudomonadales bacterium]|nr:4Fe-4S dicluster domain-containing protein [Anaerolineales bacterium]MCB8916576.1 4Fe-4S dicluster domain-containing protein [Ardenticatenaceae bacterium]MCP5190348.1 4Fe-4S dicluster domain-containing protein [Pseudomonadales bacterium]